MRPIEIADSWRILSKVRRTHPTPVTSPREERVTKSNEIERDARNDVREKERDLKDRDPSNVERVE
jgi:hypothetical protein